MLMACRAQDVMQQGSTWDRSDVQLILVSNQLCLHGH